MESSVPRPGDRDGGDRRRAAASVAPFLALGLANVLVLLWWGLDPLWAFMILPPILAITAIGWVAVRYGFHEGPPGPNT
ncbi:hypothetical protein ACFO5R_09075 [Halosolutus amylolyticus]|uniref:DUF8142 domain-containing protein n=1 Tax=Halosolutus amylolyticus TaxID=2932267 RepID=A0ABD5PNT1_9EURY|nr:hypothetical protein [Halosolutus amylolyticus]